jgi:phosphatidylglycerophosphatase A
MKKKFFQTGIIFFIFVLTVGLGPAKCAAEGFDHSLFDKLLKKNVSNGFVAYSSLAEETDKIDQYLRQLAVQDPDLLTKDEQIAFYINAYNAFTIKLILNYLDKIKSIRDIDKPWDQKIWNINGRLLSLNDIEHKILREKYDEPRIHFAIVCASIGCPDLQPFAFTGKHLEKQLTEVTRAFFASPKNLQISGRTIKLSRIFKWFAGDFKKGGSSLTEFVRKNADKEIAAKLAAIGERAKVRFLDYDWNLNGR